MSLGGSSGYGGWLGSRLRTVPLHSETVALSAPGVQELVPRGRADTVLPGTRVLADAESADQLVAQEQDWLATAGPWLDRAGPWREMATGALLDLRILGIGLPATVAGWSKPWRYVWPRDVAHVCAALAAVGHLDEAVSGLRFLQFVQGVDGRFEARYRPDGTGPPDGRHPQLDGLGWALWGAGQVIGAMPADRASRTASELTPLITAATHASQRAIDTPDGLPAASPDYWELFEDDLTLGTVAPILAGLRCAPTLLRLVGAEELAASAERDATHLGIRLHDTFSPLGYPRRARGGARDAAVAFLTPAYAGKPGIGVRTALRRASRSMARPAGGLAPGGDWPEDGVSWTPETALFALAEASLGNRDQAQSWLRWLDAHRTAAGSYPEKVLHDGSPAEVAPLAWTAALVVLTIDTLTR